MNVDQLLVEIRRLSLDERLAVLEALSHDLRESLRSQSSDESSLERVRGLLKPDKPYVEDDDEPGYVDYLLKKYS